MPKPLKIPYLCPRCKSTLNRIWGWPPSYEDKLYCQGEEDSSCTWSQNTVEFLMAKLALIQELIATK